MVFARLSVATKHLEGIASQKPTAILGRCAFVATARRECMVKSPPFIKQIIERAPDSHKGDNGRIVVFGGSTDYYGAPALVALAALRAGADLVFVVVPEKIAPTIASYSPDIIVREYQGTNPNITAISVIRNTSHDVLVIGNGLGRIPTTQTIVKSALKKESKPAILDADALFPSVLKHTKKGDILTPHTAEFRRVFKEELPSNEREKEAIVRSCAKSTDTTILLKGPHDIISDGERTFINETGNPGMTVGGTGDVLAGITAAFRCKLPSYESACAAAYVCGRAGDMAFKDFGNSLLATDVIKYIPSAIKELK